MSSYLTVPEVCDRLHCGDWAARRLLRSGALRGSMVAGKWLTTQDAVEAYVESQSIAPTTTPLRRRRRRSA